MGGVCTREPTLSLRRAEEVSAEEALLFGRAVVIVGGLGQGSKVFEAVCKQ